MDDATTGSSTPMMTAVQQEVLGSVDVLHQVQVPRPVPGPGEVLIAVHAAGINPTDWGHRYGNMFLNHMPRILGWDVSGVIEEVGLGVAVHEPGDEVFGMLPYPKGVGSHAEYVVGPARAFVAKPPGIDHVQAGALPLVALTAFQALVDTAKIQPGQRVLIHAAAGGVGHVAVQIAKARGAYVIGTASAGKHDLLRTLGADELIDYHETDFTTVVAPVDVVLDTLSGEVTRRSLSIIKPGGTLISLLGGASEEDLEYARQHQVSVKTVLVEADHASMLAISCMVQDGQLQSVIAATFPLRDAAQAHLLGEEGRTTGKIVLTMKEDSAPSH
ncbi:NADPH:quinone reductase-like Zn-dependent oxidoreductase [Kibdelosporangium banguiense]|uniref:NADPH:quinone reductase-like Zn-dependent oxidoreductase n=1 Tax=Kibdelosporangium banguiense TaxID=1365924 RepID=A0ABS4TYJ1_9PSEU|nr:NADP-dependent oxidoreductase [Kibdelosporangium banguiense]MBP2329460.1 NADPH:quinone reductase-like Zn-dependent oxidoreductase [Kibdelosporangium banguiense]